MMRLWDWINQLRVDPRHKTLIIPFCIEIGESSTHLHMFLLQEIHLILCRSLPHLIGPNRIYWPCTTDYQSLPSSPTNPLSTSKPLVSSKRSAGSPSDSIVAISVLTCPPWAKPLRAWMLSGSVGQFSVFVPWASFASTGFRIVLICMRVGSS